jgi:hypothetical protein
MFSAFLLSLLEPPVIGGLVLAVAVVAGVVFYRALQ